MVKLGMLERSLHIEKTRSLEHYREPAHADQRFRDTAKPFAEV